MAPSADASRGRLYTALGTGAVLVGGLAYVGLGDPHRPDFLFPPCPFNALTGWNCPGCGGLRMTHDVLHGDFAAAVVDNVVRSSSVCRCCWSGFCCACAAGGRVMTPAAVVVITVAAITWTVVRNLPGFPLVPTLLDG